MTFHLTSILPGRLRGASHPAREERQGEPPASWLPQTPLPPPPPGRPWFLSTSVRHTGQIYIKIFGCTVMQVRNQGLCPHYRFSSSTNTLQILSVDYDLINQV